ncbi:hypothetical protein [Limnohabitans sp. Rim8]|uniref:hypothetical protein n=1 Tax=Limnohabitans sp. Rim8 TaxID=1100718 RepID=UPI0026355503|nr:hypothetical protein [Limnohabitans sp. Rim8]
MNRYLASVLTGFLVLSVLLLFPLLPIVAALAFWQKHFLLNYFQTLKKIWRHLQAMCEGPAIHYFADVMGRASQVPEVMGGSCVQCGNCCMNKRCMFLQPIANDKFQCGIYSSPLRRFSNCGSFPLNAYDIERYECPSYFVIPIAVAKLD